MSDLNFRVFHCSSQDSIHMASELASNSGRDDDPTVGWQSQRFCVYPQEIIVQFSSSVQIQQIQLLVHETKIPREVELFSYMPGGNQSESYHPTSALGQSQLITPLTANILFQRLGHFSLDNNMQSNFQSREFKTVHISVPCQYFKLVLHKNYENPHNSFN